MARAPARAILACCVSPTQNVPVDARMDKEERKTHMLPEVDLVTWLPPRFRTGEMARFIKFALVGALGMVVDLTILNVLHGLVGFHLLVANSISFSAAVVSNFTWNRLWTFPETRNRPVHTQLAQFATVSVIGLGINNFILWQLYHLFRPYLGSPWNYNAAKILAIGVVLFWNFGVNRLWTFRDV